MKSNKKKIMDWDKEIQDAFGKKGDKTAKNQTGDRNSDIDNADEYTAPPF